MADNFFGNIFDTLKTAATSVVNSIEDIPQEWQKQVDELKAKAATFMAMFTRLGQLAHVAARDPVTKAQYDILMARGASIKAKIESITRAIDNMYGAASSLFNGVGNTEGLGFLPLIPIAVIAGAVTLISVWLIDALSMSQKLQAAESAGANAAQITSIATGSGGTNGTFLDKVTGGSSMLKNAGILLLIGAGIYLLLPVVKQALKGR